MALPIANTQVYGDFASLEALKKAARSHDPGALRQVAQAFESLFARMLIKSMRDAIGPDPIFGSDQEQAYQKMYDDQLSMQITRGPGLGLADMLVRQLQSRYGAAAGGSTGSGTGASPAVGSAGAATAATPAGSAAPPPPSTRAPSLTERTAFVRALWPQACRAARELGVAPQSLVAQAALETGWGGSIPQDASGRSSHNLFGVKALGAWQGPRAATVTHEVVEGAARTTRANFRVYGSTAQSFADYVALLRGDPRYAPALDTGSNAAAFAGALQRGGYSTDPQYARKLSAIAGEVCGIVPAADPLNSAAGLPITAGATRSF